MRGDWTIRPTGLTRREKHTGPKFAVECRNKDGTLRLRDEQGKHVPEPPFSILEGASENEIYDYYFAQNPNAGDSATQEQIRAWYAERNWYWRPKTW